MLGNALLPLTPRLQSPHGFSRGRYQPGSLKRSVKPEPLAAATNALQLAIEGLVSASIAASLVRYGSVTATPPVFDLAEPVVADDRVAADDPDESPLRFKDNAILVVPRRNNFS